MDLDFLEIGTSDFNTLIQYSDENTVGISIEPIKYYLDKLPNKSNCIKINCAISDYEGKIDIYYVPPEKIEKYNFDECFKGCNSVNKQHPTIRQHLIRQGFNPDEIFSVDTVPVRLIGNILEEYNINSIKFFKIDTEGHDCIILNSFFDYLETLDKGNNILPKYIMFESNVLSDSEEIDKVIQKCESLGFYIVSKSSDTLLSRECFGDSINNVYLSGYLPNYDPLALPYENTLEDAKRWCLKNKGGGITYQYGRYEVRAYREPKLDLNYPALKSWICLIY